MLDPTSNVNGRPSVDGRLIDQIDAGSATQTPSVDPSDGSPIANPFKGTVVTSGVPSVWADLYSVTLNRDSTLGGAWSVTVSGFLSIGSSAGDVAGLWNVDTLSPPGFVTATFATLYPSPSAAVLLGLGGLAAARRRR